MARGRSRGRPRKGEEDNKSESSNAFEALEELQDLGFSQEDVVEMLRKVKNDEAVSRISKEVAMATDASSSGGNHASKRRSWADVVEEGEVVGAGARGPGSQEGVQKKSWAEIAKENRDPQNGIALRYVKPGEVIKFTYEELQTGAKLWNNSLVGMVIGASPSYIEVAKYVRTAWEGKGLGRVHQLRKGVYLFDFKTEEERSRVMEGFWAIYGRYPLLLKPWQAGKGVEDHFDKIPIWIKLPHLNLDLWEPENLGKVASYVGRPITTDACTAARSRVDYVRVMVEVPFMGALPEEIPLQTGDEPVYKQPVVYEWKPVACGVCGWFGHGSNQCKRKINEEIGKKIEEEGVVEEAKGDQGGRAVEVEVVGERASLQEVIPNEEGKGKERNKEKIVTNDKTPKEPKEKNKQVVVSKTPILQNLPIVKNKKAWEVAGKGNGGKKTTHPNG